MSKKTLWENKLINDELEISPNKSHESDESDVDKDNKPGKNALSNRKAINKK